LSTELLLSILAGVSTVLAAIAVNMVYRYKARVHVLKQDAVQREFWRRDPHFSALVGDLSKQTELIVDPIRSYTLYQLARAFAGKEGEIAEVGVYKGGTARILAAASPTKRLHLFDTFQGMPSSDPTIDYHPVGDFSDTSFERVQTLLSDCPNVKFHVGTFPDTAGPIVDARFALVHLDVDNYESNRDALAFFYARMVPGGAIVFDDYEWQHTAGIRKSIDEFLADKPERVVRTAEYQAVMFKL